MQIRFERLEDLYNKDVSNKNVIHITTAKGINELSKERELNGIYSPLFGSDLSGNMDENNTYSCICGSMYGKFNKNEICPNCSTEVLHYDSYKKKGWIISLHDVIVPYWYKYIGKVVGFETLKRILQYNNNIDENGNLITIDPSTVEKYSGIGIIEFYNKFDEIMEYYKIQNNKDEYYEFIMNNKKYVFTKHIPVAHLSVRPILKVAGKIIYSEINKNYTSVVSNILSANRNTSKTDKMLVRKLTLLYEAQHAYNIIDEELLSMISGKEGEIRKNLLGCRVNFSARMVITPIVDEHRINEIHLPYLTAIELYKYEILNTLVSKYDYQVKDAEEKIEKAKLTFDKSIYLIMNKILVNKNTKLMINRNPSLAYGSLLSMRVSKIKEDIEDVTMSIPINILGYIAGDFDGDTLSVYALDEEIMAELDELFNPILMMIDRSTAEFNEAALPIKDQCIALWSFNNV